MVIHSDDGLDEFSIADKTYVAELKDGIVSTYSVHPEDFGLTLGDLKDIRADNADASLALITEAFSGRNGTAKSIISLNAGAAIYVSGLTTRFNQELIEQIKSYQMEAHKRNLMNILRSAIVK